MKIFFATKFPGYYVTKTGKVFRDPQKNRGEKNPVEVSQHLRGGAYKKMYPSVNITLRDENGKRLKQIRQYVHRLVAETLVENSQGFVEIDHIDGDKLNNSVENLRWCSRETNVRHMIGNDFYKLRG